LYRNGLVKNRVKVNYADLVHQCRFVRRYQNLPLNLKANISCKTLDQNDQLEIPMVQLRVSQISQIFVKNLYPSKTLVQLKSLNMKAKKLNYMDTWADDKLISYLSENSCENFLTARNYINFLTTDDFPIAYSIVAHRQ